jgi:hypothetical protein
MDTVGEIRACQASATINEPDRSSGGSSSPYNLPDRGVVPHHLPVQDRAVCRGDRGHEDLHCGSIGGHLVDERAEAFGRGSYPVVTEDVVGADQQENDVGSVLSERGVD